MGKLLDGIYDAISGLDAPVRDGSVTVSTMNLPLIDLRTGEKHSVDGALKSYYSNAFRACLLAKARPIAALPIDVYTRANGVREKANGHMAKRLSRILRHRWNPTLTSAEGIRWTIMTKDTLGNAYVREEWGANGLITALWPMTGAMEVSVTGDGRPVFDYSGDRHTPAGRYLSHEVIWVKSPIIDDDGLKGVSLAGLAARELGLSIDLERFYEKLITNGNHFPQWLETDASLQQSDVDKVAAQLSDHKGITAAGEMRIFDHGMKVRQQQLSITDMSLVEQETWILQQVCRTLSVPPQKVFDLSHATYSNVEQGALDFAKDTLTPECRTLEQAFSDPLWLGGSEDEYVQFNMDGLMRGDYQGRMNGYRTSVLSGWMTMNQVCEKEDLPPFVGGDVHMIPSAYSIIDPETGEIAPGTGADVGGSGEGVATTTGEPNGRPEDALVPVHDDMEHRVSQRFEDKGDTEQTRDFARRVLEPYRSACAGAHIEYDMEQDIERMAENARH
jgi:HK97 family phage portal protein